MEYHKVLWLHKSHNHIQKTGANNILHTCQSVYAVDNITVGGNAADNLNVPRLIDAGSLLTVFWPKRSAKRWWRTRAHRWDLRAKPAALGWMWLNMLSYTWTQMEHQYQCCWLLDLLPRTWVPTLHMSHPRYPGWRTQLKQASLGISKVTYLRHGTVALNVTHKVAHSRTNL